MSNIPQVFLILALALVARAEPPVDSWGMQPPAVNALDSSYGPPNQQFGTPIRSNGLTDARFTGFGSRTSSPQYSGAPSMPESRYLPASRTAAARMPAQQYGAPSGFEGYPDARNAFDDDMSVSNGFNQFAI